MLSVRIARIGPHILTENTIAISFPESLIDLSRASGAARIGALEIAKLIAGLEHPLAHIFIYIVGDILKRFRGEVIL